MKKLTWTRTRDLARRLVATPVDERIEQELRAIADHWDGRVDARASISPP